MVTLPPLSPDRPFNPAFPSFPGLSPEGAVSSACSLADLPETLHYKKLGQICRYFSTEETYYRPQTKFREGNVFTPVCHSVCSAWQGVCVVGGMHGRRGVCARGACMAGGGACMQETWPLKQAVCIRLECILISNKITHITLINYDFLFNIF